MKRKDILRKLEERLARGEINEKTYLEIKARYESEPDEPEDLGEATLPSVDLSATIGNAVAQATAEAARVAEEATRFVGDTMRAMDFTGVVSGGSAKLSDESIKIVGSGVVRGNPIRTHEFKSAGSARVQGTLIAEVAKVAGSCTFEGDVQVEEFRSAGSVHIVGDLKAESVEASGSLQVDGSIHAEEISSGGSLHVKGAVESEKFESGGAIRLDGGLKAEEIRIDLGGSSKVSKMEGESIQVKATGGFFRVRGDLMAERIEGESVELEATTAKLVKGENVNIGPLCKVDTVEARNLVVHESSEVRERRTAS
jgi:cytoskeletal protein CcmA (bactofilin family)